jgi:bifunctional pyridoxal-dependent enzyme with beta-cystathionase and maltose regulon repressor activities
MMIMTNPKRNYLVYSKSSKTLNLKSVVFTNLIVETHTNKSKTNKKKCKTPQNQPKMFYIYIIRLQRAYIVKILWVHSGKSFQSPSISPDNETLYAVDRCSLYITSR